MGPKQTPSKPGKTLFSYFTKSPATSKGSQPNTNGSEVLSQKKSPNKSDSATPVKQAKKQSNEHGNRNEYIVFIAHYEDLCVTVHVVLHVLLLKT